MGVVEGHAGEQTVAALAQFGVDVLFTLNGGHIWPLLRGGPQPGRAGRRHPPRAVRDVRRRGLGQADPPARRRRADRRPGHHQRRLGGHVGVVQRLAARRARWASTAAALGSGLAAGAGPRADPQLDHEVVDDAHGSDEGRRRRARGRRAGAAATPRAGVRRLPARRLRAGLGRGARRSTAPDVAVAGSGRRRATGRA